ncbi:hypothetical protein BU17DRAFT_50494 [Hysterangium stoloniferum]|nr:hypothetical protein BU17DRAFT_50494 [Hysterangium stoloniferum]
MSKPGLKDDDVVPKLYPYYWNPQLGSSIEEFVNKYKPSMVQDDGTKPWLWVQNSNSPGPTEEKTAAVDAARALLAEATEKIQQINDDDTIPTRASKKTGAKSKKQLKEEIQVEYSKKLKEVHKEHDYAAGKWLAFVAHDMVDAVWTRLATSVATGPLSETVVYLAKVATTPANESNSQRVICVYIPDVLDKNKIIDVMRILLQNHGLNLSGVKSNLYTEIGLDSKHPSHIQSTTWKNTDLLKDNEIKDLKEVFYNSLGTIPKAPQTDGVDDAGAKKKLQGKPRPVTDDPFASDDEEEKPKSKAKPIDNKSKTTKRKGKDSDESEHEKQKKKRLH